MKTKDGYRCRLHYGTLVKDVPHCITREAFIDQARYRQVLKLLNETQNVFEYHRG